MAVTADAAKLAADELISVIALFEQTASTYAESTVAKSGTSPEPNRAVRETSLHLVAERLQGPRETPGRGD